MEWIKYHRLNPPPQGLKIVCFKGGDLWIARRINHKGQDYWLEIPFGGKKGAISTGIPDYWMKLDLPEGYTGFLKLHVEDGPLLTLDEATDLHMEAVEELTSYMVSTIVD